MAKMKQLQKEVDKANTTVVKRALRISSTPTSTPTPAPSRAVTRTACQPDFGENDKPMDVNRVVDLASLAEADFRSTHQLLSSA